MSPWLPGVPTALLLILLPGCLSLRVPSSMNGTIGGSLSVRCSYKKKDAGKEKYWCRYPCVTRGSRIASTSATDQGVTSGHVTIWDDPGNLTFTVTLKHLRAADAGIYACGISRSLLKIDRKDWFEVTVFPAPQTTSASPETSREPAVFTWPKTTQKDPPNLSPSAHSEASSRGSSFSSIHFRLLVFLKLPILLGMIGAVLWASWPRSAPHPPNTPVDGHLAVREDSMDKSDQVPPESIMNVEHVSAQPSERSCRGPELVPPPACTAP